MRARSFKLLALLFAGFLTGCAPLTPQQERTETILARCQEEAGPARIIIREVRPDGSWHATVPGYDEPHAKAFWACLEREGMKPRPASK